MRPIFLDLLPEESITLRKFGRGEKLFHFGQEVSGFYFVKRGAARLERHSSNGETIIIHQAKPGETFAEASLFSDHYHCDAIAVSDCEVEHIDKQIALSCQRRDPRFAAGLAAHLAQQLQSNRRLLELRSIRSARDRVLAGVEEGLLVSDIKTFASEIGLTHEVTYRALSSLATSGLIIKEGRGHYLSISV